MSIGSLLYKSPEGRVEELLEYLNDLREERDRALKQVENRQKYHPTPKTLPRRKYIEDPEFRYEFGHTVLGKVCSITCKSCEKKAIQKSKGNLARFDKICKQLEVSCIIGEV